MDLRPLSEIFPADYINPPSEEKLRRTCHEVTDQSDCPIDVIDYLGHIYCPKEREATATVLYQCILSGEIQVNSFERESFLFRLGSIIRAAKVESVQKAMKTVDDAIVSPHPQESVVQTIPIVNQMDKDMKAVQTDLAFLKEIVFKMAQAVDYFPYFTKKAIEEHQTESVMAAIRRAATGPAKNLVRELNLQDALGYIDILNVNSTDLFNTLSRFLTVPYDIRNFRKYRH